MGRVKGWIEGQWMAMGMGMTDVKGGDDRIERAVGGLGENACWDEG